MHSVSVPMGSKIPRNIILIVLLMIVAVIIPSGAWIVSSNSRLSFMNSMMSLQTIGSVGLSAILAYLYIEIRDIQSNQEELMKVQYEPEIKATISSGTDEFPVVLVRNSGFAAAIDLSVRRDIGEATQENYYPFLAAGDSIEYPLYVDDDPLSSDELLTRIKKDMKEREQTENEEDEESDRVYGDDRELLDENLTCTIDCRDVKGEPQGFKETFEVRSQLRELENVKVRTEVDALEDISSDLESIETELQTMNNDLLGVNNRRY